MNDGDRRWVENSLTQMGIPLDTIDYESIWDSSLSLKDNWRNIKSQIPPGAYKSQDIPNQRQYSYGENAMDGEPQTERQQQNQQTNPSGTTKIYMGRDNRGGARDNAGSRGYTSANAKIQLDPYMEDTYSYRDALSSEESVVGAVWDTYKKKKSIKDMNRRNLTRAYENAKYKAQIRTVQERAWDEAKGVDQRGNMGGSTDRYNRMASMLSGGSNGDDFSSRLSSFEKNSGGGFASGFSALFGGGNKEKSSVLDDMFSKKQAPQNSSWIFGGGNQDKQSAINQIFAKQEANPNIQSFFNGGQDKDRNQAISNIFGGKRETPNFDMMFGGGKKKKGIDKSSKWI